MPDTPTSPGDGMVQTAKGLVPAGGGLLSQITMLATHLEQYGAESRHRHMQRASEVQYEDSVRRSRAPETALGF